MRELDLSVCIVNWNTKEELYNCLRSVYEQSWQVKFEVIVVDNASSDGSLEMLRREFRQAKVIPNETNRGFAAANNQALRASSGKYILFLNPDAIIGPTALDKMTEFMEKHRKVGILGCKILSPDGTIFPSCRRFPTFWAAVFRRTPLGKLFPKNRFVKRYLMLDWDHNQAQEVDWVSFPCVMVRREVLEEIGFLDERFFMYCEDIDFCYRAKGAGWKVYYLPDAFATHLRGRSSDKAPLKMILQHHKSMYLFYRKHYAKRIYLFLEPLIIFGLALRAGMLMGKNRYDYLRNRWLAIREKTLGRAVEALLLILMALTPIFLGRFNVGAVTCLSLIAGLAFLVYLIKAMAAGLLKFQLSLFDFALVGFFVAALLSLPSSVNLHNTLVELSKLFSYILIYGLAIGIGELDGSKIRNRLLWVLICSSVFVAWRGIYEYRIANNPTWRIFSTFENPNSLAGFLSMVIPVALSSFWALFRHSAGQSRLFKVLFAFMVLMVLALLVDALKLTGSRGGFLSFFCAMVLYLGFLSFAKWKRARSLVLASCLIFIMVGGAILVSTPVGSRRLQGITLNLQANSSFFRFLASQPLIGRLMTSFTEQQHSNIFRWLTAESAWKITLAFPVSGTGLGAFEYIYPKYALGGFTRMAHNNYLQIGAETGFLGLLTFIWLIVSFYFLSLKYLKREGDFESKISVCGLVSGVSGFLVHSFFDYGLYLPAVSLTFWLFMALSLAIARSSKSFKPLELTAELRGLKRYGIGVVLVIFALLFLFNALRPYAASLYRYQAEKAAEEGDLELALENYEKAKSWSPLDGKLRLELGEFLAYNVFLSGDSQALESGIEEIKRAIRLQPTNARVHLHLGLVYSFYGRHKEAIEEYQKATELNPHYTRAFVRLAEELLRVGKEAEALRAYQRVAAIENSDYEKYKAIPYSVDANYAYAHQGIARILIAKKDYANALRELRKAKKVLKEYKAFQTGLDIALQYSGEFEETKWLELKKLEVQIYRDLGYIYEEKNMPAEAREMRERAKEIESREKWLE